MAVNFDQFITTEELVRLYYCEGQSLEELAAYLGVDRKTLIRHMDNLKLPRRQDGDSAELKRHMRGPICPHCGSRDSRVYQVRWHPKRQVYLRYRQCKICEGRFETAEETVKKLSGKRK